MGRVLSFCHQQPRIKQKKGSMSVTEARCCQTILQQSIQVKQQFSLDNRRIGHNVLGSNVSKLRNRNDAASTLQRQKVQDVHNQHRIWQLRKEHTYEQRLWKLALAEAADSPAYLILPQAHAMSISLLYVTLPTVCTPVHTKTNAWRNVYVAANGKENRARSYLTDTCAGAAGAHKDKITERKPGVRVKGRGTFFPRAYEDGAMSDVKKDRRPCMKPELSFYCAIGLPSVPPGIGHPLGVPVSKQIRMAPRFRHCAYIRK